VSVRTLHIQNLVTLFVGLRRTWHWKAGKVKFVYAFNSGSCCFFITPNRLLRSTKKFPLALRSDSLVLYTDVMSIPLVKCSSNTFLYN
jgi:hypothetical protein